MAKEDLAAEAGEKQEPAPRLASSFAELGICKEMVEACNLMGWEEPGRLFIALARRDALQKRRRVATGGPAHCASSTLSSRWWLGLPAS